MAPAEKPPWLIAGCGPSLRIPEEPFRVATLNRAVSFFPHPDIAFIFHSLTLEAVAGDLKKAKMVVFAAPLDGHGDWKEGRLIEDPRSHPLFKSSTTPRKTKIMFRGLDDPQERRFEIDSKCCLPRGPVSVGALAYLVKTEYIRRIYTVGIDGGPYISEEVRDAYSNRKVHSLSSYSAGHSKFERACRTYGVEWVRL